MKNQFYTVSDGIFKNHHQAFFFLLALSVLSVSVRPTEAGQNPVAKVNNTILREADLEEALNEIMPAGVFHGGFSSEKRLQYKPQAIEKMIENELFYQEAVDKGLQVDRALIKARRDSTIKRFGGMKRFKAALYRAGISDEEYQAKLEKKQLVEKLITVEVVSRAETTDVEVGEYYQQNKEKFMRPEARKIRQIQISVEPNATPEEREQKRKRAREVISRIEAGEDMAAVAWEYSDDKYRVKGGDLGLVHRGRLELDLEQQVFKLKIDQLSGIIETIYGFHVVRVEEIRNPEQLSLEDISIRVKKELAQKKEEQYRIGLIRKLKSRAMIEVY
ncbi:MAG: peptidylprolyl isomerase [Desulfobulbaceae bacterium]|nr:peptidylprolyl isomerase [Desulfobulbaceae bacterium]